MVLVGGAILFVIALYVLLIEPTMQGHAQVKQRLSTASVQLQSLATQEQALKLQLAEDPNQSVNARITRVKQMLEEADNLLGEKLQQLVPARQMPELLKNLLAKNDGVTLLEMRSIAPQAITLSEQQKDKETLLFRHGVALSLEGPYGAIRQYLTELENLPWQFQWREFDYTVSQYPNAQVRLEIFTVSTNEAFIGV